MVKNLPAMPETGTRSLGREEPLEKTTHSSTPAWRMPWTEEPGVGYNLQFMAGSQESDTTEQLTQTHYYTQEGSLPHRMPTYPCFTSLCVRICTRSALVNGNFSC